MTRTGAVFLSLLLIPACAPRGGGEGAGDDSALGGPSIEWPGCYTLSVEAGEWRLPRALALDSVPLQGWESFSRNYREVYRARSWQEPGGPPRDTPFAYWRPLDGDSVVVGHPGALAGVTLRLGPGGEGAQGLAVAFTDVISPGETNKDSAAVRLSRVSCETLEAGGGG